MIKDRNFVGALCLSVRQRVFLIDRRLRQNAVFKKRKYEEVNF